ncbi:hypothetical protein Dda_9130 [Drechslerella dactyloides]|uniref:Uncharacterized protein n=1 Tax=Drechslerella dactyloides TaxID=74499 RepID=A0AAD6IPJ3_DREDA|nr:hypothetical protein Dda_9130 [Drechslerella dactyloides]
MILFVTDPIKDEQLWCADPARLAANEFQLSDEGCTAIWVRFKNVRPVHPRCVFLEDWYAIPRGLNVVNKYLLTGEVVQRHPTIEMGARRHRKNIDWRRLPLVQPFQAVTPDVDVVIKFDEEPLIDLESVEEVVSCVVEERLDVRSLAEEPLITLETLEHKSCVSILIDLQTEGDDDEEGDKVLNDLAGLNTTSISPPPPLPPPQPMSVVVPAAYAELIIPLIHTSSEGLADERVRVAATMGMDATLEFLVRRMTIWAPSAMTRWQFMGELASLLLGPRVYYHGSGAVRYTLWYTWPFGAITGALLFSFTTTMFLMTTCVLMWLYWKKSIALNAFVRVIVRYQNGDETVLLDSRKRIEMPDGMDWETVEDDNDTDDDGEYEDSGDNTDVYYDDGEPSGHDDEELHDNGDAPWWNDLDQPDPDRGCSVEIIYID